MKVNVSKSFELLPSGTQYIQETKQKQERQYNPFSLSIMEYQTVRILIQTDEEGGTTAGTIAKKLKLTRGRICQILKKLETEGYVKSNTEIKKCYICNGTGSSWVFKERQCIACKGVGERIHKGNPVFYTVRNEAKTELENVINMYDKFRMKRIEVMR